MTANRIRWQEIDSGTYEDMVAVLINRLHPQCRRIDGSGGDAGRDVHLQLPDGLEIFELKSFTGRINGTRREQVRRSLKRAAQHEPRRWHLVVPIDPTPAEERWFDELQATQSFECHWRGKTWLDSELARHPDIARYFLHGSSDEVVRILAELHHEQAALAGGVPDAVDRLRTLAAQVNELDPYFAFVLTSHPDGNISVVATPKYAEAEKDRPVGIGGAFRFKDDEGGKAAAHAFAEAVNYGKPVTLSGDQIEHFTIDAPGMPPQPQHIERFMLGPVASDASLPDLRFDLRIYEEERLSVQLPLVLTERTSGQRGAILTLTDHGGAITVTLTVDAVDRHVKLDYTFSQPPGVLPSQLIPPVQFFNCMRPGASMAVAVEGSDIGPPIGLHRTPDDDIPAFLELLMTLDRIQRATHCFFPLPVEFSAGDLHNIRKVQRLLDGETVSEPLNELRLTATVGLMEELRSGPLGSPRGAQLDDELPLSIPVAGNEIPLGRAHRSAKCVVPEWPATTPGADPSDQVETIAHPVFNHSVQLRLVGDERASGRTG